MRTMTNEKITNSAAMLILSAACTSFPKTMKNEWINTTHLLLSLSSFMFRCSGAALVSIVFENGDCRVVHVFSDDELKEPINLKFDEDADEYKYNGFKLGVPKSTKIVSFDIVEKRNEINTKYKDIGKDYVLTLERCGLNTTSLFNIAKKYNPSLEHTPEAITTSGDLKVFFNDFSKRYEMRAKLNGVKDIGEILFSCPAKYSYYEMLVTEKEANPNSLLDPLLLCTALTRIFTEFNEPEDLNPVTTSDTLTKKPYKKKEVKKTKEDVKETKFSNLLDKNGYLSNMNKELLDTPHSVYDCNSYISRIFVELDKSHNNIVALVGPDGVGKNTIIKELVRNINENNVPDVFKGYNVYRLKIDELTSFQAKVDSINNKLESIFEELSIGKTILFMDDPSNLLGVNQNQMVFNPGMPRAAEALINAAEDENIKCIITTDTAGFKKLIADPELNNIIKRINVTEPSSEIVFKVLKSKFEDLSEKGKYTCNDSVLNYIIKNSATWEPNGVEPCRSLSLLDSCIAYMRVRRPADSCLSETIVDEYLSEDSGLFITENKAQATYDFLKSKLLDQDEALMKVYENLTMAECGFNAPTKPKATILLAGPTGVGKTETAKGIARAFYGSDKALVTLNMAEYGDKTARNKLIGSSAGYIGYDDKPYLFREAEEKRQFVLLIDELDKADPSIYDVLLRILDEGILTDNKGNDVSFRNCIVVMTTNAGFEHGSNESHGSGIAQVKAGTSNVEKALKNALSPEFLSRVSSYNIVKYNYLDDSIIDRLIERIRKEVLSTATIHNKDIILDEEDIAEVKKNADVKHYGARELDNTVRLIITRKYMQMKKEEQANG